MSEAATPCPMSRVHASRPSAPRPRRACGAVPHLRVRRTACRRRSVHGNAHTVCTCTYSVHMHIQCAHAHTVCTCTYSVHMRGGQRCSAPDDLDDLPCFTSRRCSASSTISTCQTGCATASPRSASPCSAPISSPRRCSNGSMRFAAHDTLPASRDAWFGRVHRGAYRRM
jgi:hypothetical protein